MDELADILSQSIEQRLPAAELERDGKILKLLGVIPPNYDFRGQIIAKYATRLSAFYSPELGKFILSQDMGSEREMVLAHEYGHALQDQHYDLKRLTDIKLSSDESLARSAVFEGDANLLMKRYAGFPICQARDFKTEIKALDELKDLHSELPAFLEIQIAAPYFLGESYLCRRLQSVIGDKEKFTAALDQVYSDLPASTAELFQLPKPEPLRGVKETCTKRESLGVLGIVSLLGGKWRVTDTLRLLKTLNGDALCLEENSASSKLEWEIEVEDASDRGELARRLTEYLGDALSAGTFEVKHSDTRVIVKSAL
jgi:hypothetical protein